MEGIIKEFKTPSLLVSKVIWIMNFHTDKIECVLILFHILIVHVISASPYKLKNIILAPYIGKPQEGVDNKLIALKKVRHQFMQFIFQFY